METIIERWNDYKNDAIRKLNTSANAETTGALLVIAEKLDEQNKLLKEQNDLARQAIEGR